MSPPGSFTAARGWQSPPAEVALGEDEVHLWQADLDRPAAAAAPLAGVLSCDEVARADAFVFPRDRRRFIAARGALRWLLARYLACQPWQVVLRDGFNGKPELAMRGSPPLRFNHARSQGRALYAVTLGRRVGVDLEALRPVPEAGQIARRWFSPGERAQLAAVPSEQQDRAFLRTWTCKEAYAKATGDGLTRGLQGVEVSWVAGQPPTLRTIDGDPAERARWSLDTPPPIPGHVAALVVQGYGHSVSFWSGPEGVTAPVTGPAMDRRRRLDPA